MTVEFDPVPIGPSRRGRASSVVVAIALLAFLGVALLKPWATSTPGAARASAAPTPVGSATARPVAAVAPPWVTGAESLTNPPRHDPTGWSNPPAGLTAALGVHDAWGVRAVVAVRDEHGGIRPLHRNLVERWAPIDPDGTTDTTLSTSDGVVRALGVTAPAGSTPLDVRVWWLDEDARRLEVRAADPATGAGHLLLLPPRRSDGSADAWPPGRYRLDLLVGARVVILTVAVPGPSGLAPPADPFARPGAGRADTGDALDLWRLPVGLFVAARGVAQAIDAPPIGLLDDAEAWLDAGVFGRRSSVARVPASVSGIGVVLPTGLPAGDARLVRLSPSALDAGGAVDASARLDRLGRFQAATFRPGAGGSWPAGTYAVTIDWQEAGVTRSIAWHVELLPAAPRGDGAWLAPVRAWQRHAGEWGIVTGTAEPLEGGPRQVAIRLHEQQPDAAPQEPALLGDRCPGVGVVDARVPTIGIAYRSDVAIRTITAERLFTGASPLAQRVSAARDVVPGLSIVGPAPDTRWAPGYYRFTLETDAGRRALVACLGDVSAGSATVDPATGSR